MTTEQKLTKYLWSDMLYATLVCFLSMPTDSCTVSYNKMLNKSISCPGQLQQTIKLYILKKTLIKDIIIKHYNCNSSEVPDTVIFQYQLSPLTTQCVW